MSGLDNQLQLKQTQRLSQELQTAIRLLSMDLEELSGELRATVQSNPALAFLPPKNSLRDYNVRVQGGYRNNLSGDRDIKAPDLTLMDDLRQQLRLNVKDPAVLAAAENILRELTPRGFFLQSVGDFAAEYATDPAIAQMALAAVRSL